MQEEVKQAAVPENAGLNQNASGNTMAAASDTAETELRTGECEAPTIKLDLGDAIAGTEILFDMKCSQWSSVAPKPPFRPSTRNTGKYKLCSFTYMQNFAGFRMNGAKLLGKIKNIRDVYEMLSDQIRAWRRAKSVKQSRLADILGVSQATVSRWEAGADTPSREVRIRLLNLIAGETRGTAPLEQLLIERQLGYRILVDTNGLRMLGLSRGLKELWPDFTMRVGQFLEDYCVNEAAALFGDPLLKSDILSGEIAFISGTSDRHLSLREGFAMKHRWTASFRNDGSRTLLELNMEPCDKDHATGIHEVLRLADIVG